MIRLHDEDGRRLLAGEPLGEDTIRMIREQLEHPDYYEDQLFDRIVKLLVNPNVKNSLNPSLLLALRDALLKPSEWATVWANEKSVQNCRGCGKRMENNEVMTVQEGATYCFNCLYPEYIGCTCGEGSARLMPNDLKKLQKMRAAGSCQACGRKTEGIEDDAPATASNRRAPRVRPADDPFEQLRTDAAAIRAANAIPRPRAPEAMYTFTPQQRDAMMTWETIAAPPTPTGEPNDEARRDRDRER